MYMYKMPTSSGLDLSTKYTHFYAIVKLLIIICSVIFAQYFYAMM